MIAKRIVRQNSDDMQTSSDYLYAKELTLSDPEDGEIERNSFKELPDVPAAGHRIIPTGDEHFILIFMLSLKSEFESALL